MSCTGTGATLASLAAMGLRLGPEDWCSVSRARATVRTAAARTIEVDAGRAQVAAGIRVVG